MVLVVQKHLTELPIYLSVSSDCNASFLKHFHLIADRSSEVSPTVCEVPDFG